MKDAILGVIEDVNEIADKLVLISNKLKKIQWKISKISQPEKKGETCKWTWDPDGLYKTDCGTEFFFDSGDVSENKFKTCPFCGKKIEEVK